ncbi:MAG: SPOR domain-containing protein [Asticcacaulis sp.]
MNRRSVFRPVLITTCAITLCSCTAADVRQDGALFQGMAEQVAQIPVTEQDQAILAKGQKLRPSLTIEVVEPLDLYELEATSRQLRGKISTDTPLDPVKAGVQVLETAAAAAPVLETVAAMTKGVPVSVEETNTPVLRPAQRATRGPNPAVQTAAAQLGSYRSESDAKKAWSDWVARNPALKAHKPRLEQVVRADGSIWVRLKVGPVASEEDARALCTSSGVQDPWCARGVFSGRPL